MSCETRPARTDELQRLWPVVRSAHILASFDELARLHEETPWAVRVSGAGDAMVLSRWRAHLDVLAIRGLWAPDHRVGPLVDDARAVARSQGFGRVLSPLVDDARGRVYRQAGMEEVERLVVFARSTADIFAPLADSSALSHARPATRADVPECASLDEACFDDFWRHGVPELEEALRSDHFTVVSGEAGLDGYAVSSVFGSSATIGRLAVAARSRRRGVARALIAEVEGWARHEGALGISLCTQQDNQAAQALYRSTGFTALEDGYGLFVIGA